MQSGATTAAAAVAEPEAEEGLSPPARLAQRHLVSSRQHPIKPEPEPEPEPKSTTSVTAAAECGRRPQQQQDRTGRELVSSVGGNPALQEMVNGEQDALSLGFLVSMANAVFSRRHTSWFRLSDLEAALIRLAVSGLLSTRLGEQSLVAVSVDYDALCIIIRRITSTHSLSFVVNQKSWGLGLFAGPAPGAGVKGFPLGYNEMR
jgi:hypothetical protein